MNIGRYIYEYKIIYGFFTAIPFYPSFIYIKKLNLFINVYNSNKYDFI